MSCSVSSCVDIDSSSPNEAIGLNEPRVYCTVGPSVPVGPKEVLGVDDDDDAVPGLGDGLMKEGYREEGYCKPGDCDSNPQIPQHSQTTS
jgi:hypothetical protein